MRSKLFNRTHLLPTVFDWLMLIFLAVFVYWTASLCIKANSIPFEDAAMLMRYSQHLAQGYGIVWNIGEKPVDGATDFLFMALLAGVTKAGLSLEQSVFLVGILSHLITAWVIYVAVRLPIKGSIWLALAASLSFALGPGLDYVALYFGTPFFALFCSLSWLFALLLVNLPESANKSLSLSFGFSCLLMALTRPEGVFLAVFMLLAIVYYKSWSFSKPIFFWFASIFILLGGSYFLWHWHYFGYPLPNPYYKKGGGHIHVDAFKAAIKNTFGFAKIFVVIFVAGLLNKDTRARTVFSLIPIILFACIWIAMSNEMNHLNRFQYAVFPLIYMSWPLVLVGLLNQEVVQAKIRPNLVKIAATTIAILILGISSVRQFSHFRNETHLRTNRDSNYDVARILSKFADRNYTMATTEAGLLPLYSGWRSTDMWGLNDAWIAHHGGITEGYLSKLQPDVIIFHAAYDPKNPLTFSFSQTWWGLGKPWCTMVQVASQYAKIHNYVLVDCKIDGDRSHAYYYFVKQNFKDSYLIQRSLHSYFSNSIHS